jgi:hypothetical protein
VQLLHISRHPQACILATELNLARCQLTDAQKVRLGEHLEPDIADRAEKRRLANLKQGERTKPRGGHVSTSGDFGKTRDETAHTVGIGSRHTYERWLVSLPFCTYTLAEMVKQVRVSHGNRYEPLAQRTKAVIARATKHQRKLRVTRLRRRLHEQKFDLRVSRRRAKPYVDTRGQYVIFDVQHNEMIAGAHFETLEDVEAWIGEPET